MQLEKESVRQYHARLKAYLVASGMVQDAEIRIFENSEFLELS